MENYAAISEFRNVICQLCVCYLIADCCVSWHRWVHCC